MYEIQKLRMKLDCAGVVSNNDKHYLHVLNFVTLNLIFITLLAPNLVKIGSIIALVFVTRENIRYRKRIKEKINRIL